MSGIRSMTGFAIAQGQTPLGLMTLEIKSVNSRFLDISMRVCEELRQMEPVVREAVTAAVKRGKLDVRVSLKQTENAAASSVNPAALEQLIALQTEVKKHFPAAAPLAMADILAVPGILLPPEIDPDELTRAVKAVATDALAAFGATREREGAALAKVLSGNCSRIEEIVNNVEKRIPEIHQSLKEKLEQRLEDALGQTLTEACGISREELNDRIRQEITFYALKMDVAEEINRLRTHVAEVRRILDAGGPAGRRLDFVTQEMNREANTLGSKSAAIEMTDAAVGLKLCIDQMREQLQNIE